MQMFLTVVTTQRSYILKVNPQMAVHGAPYNSGILLLMSYRCPAKQGSVCKGVCALSRMVRYAGPASRVLLPDAAQGPGPGRSFLEIPGFGFGTKSTLTPGADAAPDPDALISQNWAQLDEVVSLLRTGGYPISPKLQDVPTGSAGSAQKAAASSGARPDWLPAWLGGNKSRKLLAAQAGRMGSRRRLWEAASGSWQSVDSVLGRLRADLPAEQPSGSAPASQHPYKRLGLPPSGLLLYTEYTPGLTGREGDPGFMSIFQRLSQMLGLRRHSRGEVNPPPCLHSPFRHVCDALL